jgi:two-component system phosphate regulon sensor histidine kinase PhoR
MIRRLLILGALAIMGILVTQTYLLYRTWNAKQQEFNQTANIALRNVAESISTYSGTALPKSNLIQQRSSSVYAVNINSAIDANVLEEYLEQEFINLSLNIDFEYAVYDCGNDDLVYGNYCVLDNTEESSTPDNSDALPKFDDLIYYFVVKFHNREGYLLTTMRQSLILSGIALLAVMFFLYSIHVILRQKQLTELQKDFINNMTHEFKTPISSIKIASEFLNKDERLANDPRLQKYSAIIIDQNHRLNNLVEKVLDIAKLESDQFKIKPEEVELGEFLSNIVESQSIHYQKQDGQLIYQNTTGSKAVLADKLHFTNVITNLLDNARKYSSNAPYATLRLDQHKSRTRIQISDKGEGIEPAYIKKIFDKFFRVPKGDKHDVKGFGLGLFYVKNICDAHKWEISIESKVGEGTVVTLLL